MKVNRSTAFIIFFISMIVIPLFILGWIIFGQDNSGLMYTLKVAASGLYIILIFIIGYWGFICYYLRYFFMILYLIVFAVSMPRFIALPFLYGDSFLEFLHHDGVYFILLVLAAGIMLFFIIKSITAFSYEGMAVSLSFPFKNGRYYVLEGGDSKKCSLVNYHFAGSSHTKNNVNRSMKYATDIVKVNSIGSFAQSILPRQIEKYEIYKESIYSPCRGLIIEVVDNMDNEEPFSGKHPYNVGNHIVIQNDGVNIVLGHILKGSIKVKVGDMVTQGQNIANVGNSGLTEFPHLHIQAMKSSEGSIWSGEGVPILFDGRYLVKNAMIRKK